jgi:hypothetical protein
MDRIAALHQPGPASVLLSVPDAPQRARDI